jgi:hypothetical protein
MTATNWKTYRALNTRERRISKVGLFHSHSNPHPQHKPSTTRERLTGRGARPAASHPRGGSAPHPHRRFGARIRTWRTWCMRPVLIKGLGGAGRESPVESTESGRRQEAGGRRQEAFHVRMRQGKKHVEVRTQENPSAGARGTRGRYTVAKAGLGQQCAA